MWHDPQKLLVPAGTAVGTTPTPTPTDTISSLSRLYIFLDRPEKLVLIGSGFSADTFDLRLSQEGVTKFTFSSLIPNDPTALEADFTTKDLSSLAHGFYSLELERISNGLKTTHTKQLLLTKLGDLWSPVSTEQSEQKRDAKIDIYDASRLLTKWGSTASADLAEADINPGPAGVSHGSIDIYDANKLMANWTL